MESGLLSLKWNNHKTTFFANLKILRVKSIYTDATLAVEGTFYPVHKLVMSTCSEYFSDIFERTSCKSPVIVLKDVQKHDIEALLDYMYLGEVNVNQNDLPSLLKTAECLRIKGIVAPDDDPTKLHKNSTISHDDAHRDSPPPKRRRHDSNTIHLHAASPVPSPLKSTTPLDNPAQLPSLPPHSTSYTEEYESPFVNFEMNDAEESNTEQFGSSFVKVEMDDADEFTTLQDEPPFVKVDMDDTKEQDERFRRKNNFEIGASSDRDPDGDYGSDLFNTDHKSENYGNISFFRPSLQKSENMRSLPTNETIKREERMEKYKIKCDRIISYLRNGKYPQGMSPNHARNLRNNAKTHVWDEAKQDLYYTAGKDGVKKRVITNVDDVIGIMKEYHSNPMGGHIGINSTLAKISQFYIWHGMREDITEYIKICDRCQRYERTQGWTGVLNLKGNLMSTSSPELGIHGLTGPPTYKSSPNGPIEQQSKGKTPLDPNGQSTHERTQDHYS